jgi:hypothetical protein
MFRGERQGLRQRLASCGEVYTIIARKIRCVSVSGKGVRQAESGKADRMFGQGMFSNLEGRQVAVQYWVQDSKPEILD